MTTINPTETNPTVLHAHIRELEGIILELQAMARARDIVPSPERTTNSPNTIANLYKPKSPPTTKTSIEFQAYINDILVNHDILDYKLTELTHFINQDLKRSMTPSGVARGLLKMGISLKVLRENERKRIANQPATNT